MVRLVLSKNDNIKNQIEIHIDSNQTATANKWIALLKSNLQRQVPIKKHVAMHGWIMDQTRTLKHIVDELNQTVDTINKFNFAKHAFVTKQGMIQKDFNIDLNLTIENVMQDKFNLDIVNELHDKFVQLEGAKTLDNLESVSPYFQIATPDIRWQISKLNNLAHELFHWGAEYNRWTQKKCYSPEIHIHYYDNKQDQYFTDEDNKQFTLGFSPGAVYLGDTTVGKTYWDAFNDNDKHIHNSELEPPINITADFHMHFGRGTSTQEDQTSKQNYNGYLDSRGLSNYKPAQTRVGQCLVGCVDFKKSFNSTIIEQIQNLVNEYNNVYAIMVDEYKTTYEWIMSQEEIDILQHA